MESAASLNRLELLQVADTVAREKLIDRDIVLEAMEEAIQKAARAKYGHENDIRANIDRGTGEIRLSRVLEVVEVIENEAAQISLDEALKMVDDAEIGTLLSEPLPPIDFGRIAAQTAKQVIVQKVREAERERQYEEYKDRMGDVINGIVKRVEYGNVTVDLGKADAVVRRDNLLPRENFRQGDRVRAMIFDVRREQRGPQIFLTRTHPDFMAKLFGQEVPEIYDGIIEIKAVARDPGSRAKIAVLSNDPSIDPVGACVGMRGSRVQAVVNELQGEKIDIIQWSPDQASFIVNALAPAEVAKVVMDEGANRIEVVVPDDQLSLAIGRRGQNVRLATQLSKWDIDILTEEEESNRRQSEFTDRTNDFMLALDVDETIAQLLAAEGFTSVEEIMMEDVTSIAEIEGFDEEIAEELTRRAQEFITNYHTEMEEKRLALGVSDEVVSIEVLTPPMIVALGEAGVKSLDDLADLSGDELISEEDGILREYSLDMETANAIVMAARAHWFEGEEDADSEEDVDSEEGASAEADESGEEDA